MTEVVLFLFGIAGGGGWYVWTGHISRRKGCRSCGGYGYKARRGLLSTGVIPCRTCDGEGEVLRFAARRVQRRRAVRAARAARAVREARKAVTAR
jgi:hypothetical protein